MKFKLEQYLNEIDQRRQEILQPSVPQDEDEGRESERPILTLVVDNTK